MRRAAGRIHLSGALCNGVIHASERGETTGTVWHTINSNLSHSFEKSLMHRKNMDDAIQIDVSGEYGTALPNRSLSHHLSRHIYMIAAITTVNDYSIFRCTASGSAVQCTSIRYQSGTIFTGETNSHSFRSLRNAPHTMCVRVSFTRI